MTTEPFTPHADSIQTAWVLMCQQSRISTQPPVEELEAEFDRFLARVKRDAAREALHALRTHLAASRGYQLIGPEGLDYYINTHHPEETP